MVRQIVIEAESTDDPQSMFRLSIDASLIAKGLTGEQTHLLVGEILGAQSNYAEMVTVNADGDD
jgi:hypothetical protein